MLSKAIRLNNKSLFTAAVSATFVLTRSFRKLLLEPTQVSSTESSTLSTRTPMPIPWPGSIP